MILLGVILTLAVATGSAQNSGTYLVMVPSVMRPGRPIDLSVSILQAAATSTVTATLKQGKTDIASSTSTSVSTESPGTLTIQVPSDIDTILDYIVTVEGTGDVTFQNETSIKPERKTISIFIQTDKGIYKPGQTIQFRVLAVYPDLKPYMGSFDIDLFDKNGNKIKQWRDVSNATGVVSNELQLSDQPPLGDWRLSVEANGWKEEKIFQVDEYVLPRFEVTVNLPSYYSFKMMDRLIGSVAAKYTYGEPVKGKAKINFQIAPRFSYGYQKPPSIDKYVETSDGTVDFKLTEKEMIGLLPRPSWMNDDQKYTPSADDLKRNKILVTANFTEKETGITLTGSNTVEVPYKDFNLEFLESTPESYKPGLTFTAFLKLSQADGMPPTSSQLLGDDGKQEMISLIASYSYVYSSSEVENERKEDKFEITVPASGIMKQVIDIPTDCISLNLRAEFKDVYGYHNAAEFKSQEKTGIQMTLLNQNGALKADMTANFNIKSTVSISGFQYEILSKGMIVHSGYQPSNGQNPITLDIELNSDLATKLAPSARIVAWYMTEGGEIITDSLNFNVDGVFANDVSVAFSINNTKPGETVDVSMTAYPQSYIGLLAVDQSVLLLASGNDIEESQVLAELDSYDSTKGNYEYDQYPGAMFDGKRKKRCRGCGFWWPIFSGGTDSAEIFDNAGVLVMTDALVYKSPNNFFGRYEYDMADGEMEMMPAMAAPGGNGIKFKGSTGGGGAELKEVETVRTVFPETWLWTDVFAEDDGTAKVSTKVPDTITSWVASAFALSPDKGLGLAPTRPKMTVFKPFFLSLNLPYSVIRGEEFPLQVVVFNYMEGDQDVTVTLTGSKEFKVRQGNEIDAEAIGGDVQEEVMVAAGDSGSVVFWIVPSKLGYISFEVKGQTTTAADGVERSLLVEPEGVPKEEAESMLIRLDEKTTSFSKAFQINFPAVGLVPGSESITVSAVGDIMGSSMSNLDSLLKMPYGCGEQNMLNFAPNIFVMQYLKATDQVSAEIQDKAIRFMESGYQRELTYQRKDGSFSAFGDSDASGSMWLTAFVIKSFNSAKQFIYIDQTTIDNAAKWILGKQGRDGSFQEPKEGRVLHSEMQGGSSQGLPLTAYTLVSLLENKDGLGERVAVDQAIDKALGRLESELDSITDPYSLALVTYALQLAQSEKARQAFDKLNDLAYSEDGYKYWSKTGKEETPAEPEPYWGHRQPKSVDVEMTSYALLTYAERENIDEGIPIMKWLISKRSASGGFASTQDTVLGLQSLSIFAAAATGGDTGIDVTISTDANNHSFERINKENNVLLQMAEVPVSSSQVTVYASGKGVAIVQVGLKYNVYETSNKPSVVVNLSTKEDKNKVTLNACGSWKNKEEESGMVVMEVYQLSGYAVDTTNLNDYKSKGLKRFETDAQKLTLYFDEFTKDHICVDVYSRKVTEIRNLKEARVAAYSYYSPQTVDTQFYTAETTPGFGAAPKDMGPGLVLTFLLCGLISYFFYL